MTRTKHKHNRHAKRATVSPGSTNGQGDNGARTEKRGVRVSKALPDAPVCKGLVVPEGYEVSVRAGVQKRDGNSVLKPVCASAVFIARRLRPLDLHAPTYVEIVWWTGDRWRTRQVPESAVSRRAEVERLSAYELRVTSVNALDLVRYFDASLQANAGRLPVDWYASRLGWSEDLSTFQWGQRLLSANRDQDNGRPVQIVEDESGVALLAQHMRECGSYERWLAMVEGLHTKHDVPRLLFGLYAALAPPVAVILGVRNFTVDFSSDTSGGKTTTVQLAASAWGDPAEGALLQPWHNTRNAIMGCAAALNGLPLFLDDTRQARGAEHIEGVLYDIANGAQSAKGTPEAGVRGGRGFRTIAFSTGEGLATSYGTAGGTRARVVSVTGFPLGEQSEAMGRLARDVRDCVLDNFGQAGPRFVRRLMETRDRWDAYKARYRELRDQYVQRAKGDPVAGRLAEALAVVALTAELARELLGWAWASAEAFDVVVAGVLAEAATADQALEALRALLSYCEANPGRMPESNEDTGGARSEGFLGRWPQGADTVAPGKSLPPMFHDQPLKKWLTESGWPPQEILGRWRERGWIDVPPSEKNHRFTRGVRIQGKQVRMVVLTETALVAANEDGPAGN